MYIIICEIDCQSRFDAWDRVVTVGALGWPWRIWWGGRWEGSLGWGTHVHPWLINQIKFKKKKLYINEKTNQQKINFSSSRVACPRIISLLNSLNRMWVACNHCFIVLGACLMLLLHGFVAKQVCLVLWLSKPALLIDH